MGTGVSTPHLHPGWGLWGCGLPPPQLGPQPRNNPLRPSPVHPRDGLCPHFLCFPLSLGPAPNPHLPSSCLSPSPGDQLLRTPTTQAPLRSPVWLCLASPHWPPFLHGWASCLRTTFKQVWVGHAPRPAPPRMNTSFKTQASHPQEASPKTE